MYVAGMKGEYPDSDVNRAVKGIREGGRGVLGVLFAIYANSVKVN